MPNKIVDKYLAPYRLGAAVAIPLIIVGANAMNKFHKLNMKMVETKQVDSVDASHYMAAAIGLILAVYLIWGGLYSEPKRATRFADDVASQYLNTIFSETPELRHFFHIMYNPKSIRNVSNFVCNALPDDKCQLILKSVKVLKKQIFKNEEERKYAVQKTVENIVKIVKNYADENPEFMYGVNDMIAHCYTTYVAPISRER